MLDFAHLVNSPGVDVQYFEGPAAVNGPTGFAWRKPRGCKMVYLLAVGSGASGGAGINTAATSGGGAGGGAGAQSVVIIPAMFIPDILYVNCYGGGNIITPITSGYLGASGTASFVSISRDSSNSMSNENVIYANGGFKPLSAPTSTAGGVADTAAIANNVSGLALRGFTQFSPGSVGGAGNAAAGGGVNIAFPTNATSYIPVTGGSGGGGNNGTTSSNAGALIYPSGTSGVAGVTSGLFPSQLDGGTAAAGSTPAGAGASGFVTKFNLVNLGGTGGGGCSGTAGGIAGAGGDGAPGCGGGGAGASNTTNTTLARPGAGGPGFVYIISW